MANHSATKKSIRKTKKRRLENRFYGKTTRNLIKKLKETTNKKEAEKLFPTVASKIDKLAKKHIIHKKKASNLKSKLAKRVGSL